MGLSNAIPYKTWHKYIQGRLPHDRKQTVKADTSVAKVKPPLINQDKGNRRFRL